MRRRAFIAGLGAAAASSAVWPRAARAQPRVPVIGFLGTGSPERATSLAAFRQGLSEAGYIDGRNVAIEFRWANNKLDRLPELAAGLVQSGVAAIATPFSTPAALAAKAATTTIPIIFSMGGDPVRLGLVASLSRPGGNVTGFSYLAVELTAKRLGLLHDLLPGAKRIAVLVNPASPLAGPVAENAEAAASVIGLKIEVVAAGTNDEIDAAFAGLTQKRAGALMVGPDTLFSNRREQLIALAARHMIPTIYPLRDDAEAGGLASYGASIREEFRLVGLYTGRILKGEKPAEMPVMQPTKFEFVINLKAAKALGIEVPPGLIAIADEVIE
jgi:putative ABC transport system substrate-binding protein